MLNDLGGMTAHTVIISRELHIIGRLGTNKVSAWLDENDGVE